MERLNHQAELLLKKVTAESDKHTVQDPLSELKLMWDSLEEKIVNRQVNELEGGGFIHDIFLREAFYYVWCLCQFTHLFLLVWKLQNYT